MDVIILAAQGAVDYNINPLWALLTAAISYGAAYFKQISSDKSNVKIAKIKSDSEKDELDIKLLKDEIKKLKEDYVRVKEKLQKAEEVNDKNEWLISEYSNMIKHYRFIFKLIYKI